MRGIVSGGEAVFEEVWVVVGVIGSEVFRWKCWIFARAQDVYETGIEV